MKMRNSNLGYPRIGEKREWKKLLEAFWRGDLTEREFHLDMKKIRLSHLVKQREAGIDLVPVGDFSCYDHVLDTAVMFGLIPERFRDQDPLSLQTYFSIVRGSKDKVASEMTKWFNTNYHYIVPELDGAEPRLIHNRLLELFKEAKDEAGITGKPVLVGPLTLTALSKGEKNEEILEKLVPLYVQVFKELEEEGAEWIQIDEPIFVTSAADAAFMKKTKKIYETIKKGLGSTKLLLQTYFECPEQYEELIQLPVDGIGLDFVHDSGKTLEHLNVFGFPKDKVLAAGVIDGRNIWKAELQKTAKLVNRILEKVGRDRLILQPSCSLIHVPVTAESEGDLHPLVKNALAFADEKLQEITLLTKFMNFEEETFSAYDRGISELAASDLRNRHFVHASFDEYSTDRVSAVQRKEAQQRKFSLPVLPTTTIGSFPQTKEVRAARLKYKKGTLSDSDYSQFIEGEIKKWIDIQENLGLMSLFTVSSNGQTWSNISEKNLKEWPSLQMGGCSHMVHAA